MVNAFTNTYMQKFNNMLHDHTQHHVHTLGVIISRGSSTILTDVKVNVIGLCNDNCLHYVTTVL